MDQHEPPNFYGNNYPNQQFGRQAPDMGMNQGYKNPYVNNNMPDYPMPMNENQPSGNMMPRPEKPAMDNDPNCMTELCKLNRGKSVTVYCTFTDSAEWHDKVFKGILFSASDDNIIIYNQQDGKYTIIVSVYVNFVEFYDLAILNIPKNDSGNKKSDNNQ